MLRAMEPDSDVRVLVRTTRGDMLFGIYGELASGWTTPFLEKAIAGELVERARDGLAARESIQELASSRCEEGLRDEGARRRAPAGVAQPHAAGPWDRGRLARRR